VRANEALQPTLRRLNALRRKLLDRRRTDFLELRDNCPPQTIITTLDTHKMNNAVLKVSAAVLGLLTYGCTVTVPHRIIPAGPSTYIASSGGGPYTSDSGAVRESVYKSANEFAASKGLVMVPVSEEERPYVLGRNTASVTLTFKALPKEEAAKWNTPVQKTTTR